MGWYGTLTRLFRKKQKTDEDKKAVSDIKSSREKSQRDILAPTARTQDAIKKLKAAGFTDKEIDRLMYGRK